MRRAPVVIALVSAGVILSSTAATAASQDRVSGRGTTTAGFEARVNAHSGADGQNPRGSFSVDWSIAGPSDQKIQVSCMVVVGNTAIVGGLDREGRETFVAVQDNGDNGDWLNHAIGVFGGPPPDEDRCAEVLAGPFLLAVTGNFTVVDA
jgi:hypothetical protein